MNALFRKIKLGLARYPRKGHSPADASMKFGIPNRHNYSVRRYQRFSYNIYPNPNPAPIVIKKNNKKTYKFIYIAIFLLTFFFCLNIVSTNGILVK